MLRPGPCPIGGLFTPVDAPAAQATLETAWSGGVRAFDTAPHYGAGLSDRWSGWSIAGQATCHDKGFPPTPQSRPGTASTTTQI
jgi:aryl-alcohol dehydrogenase-like predicted oxidoreductase